MKTKRNVLILLLSLFVLINVAAQEKVVIKIGGEEYEQDMPTDLQSSQRLIRDLVEMYNESDEFIVTQSQKNEKEREELLKQIEELTAKLKEAEANQEKVVERIVYVEKDVDKLLKINTRFTPFFIAGPVVGSDINIGMHVEFGGLYRMFRNLQIGGSLFSSVYQDSSRSFDIGVGIILGYSIY